MAIGERARAFLARLWHVAQYLSLLLSSILYHVLLFVLTAAPIALPIFVVVILLKGWGTFVGCIHHIGQEAPIVQTLAFIIVGAGVLGGILMKVAGAAYRDLVDLGKAPVEVVRKGWSRGSAREGPRLGPWRESMVEIANTTGKAFVRALRFAGALLIGVFLIATAYPLFARPVQTVDRYVTVVDAKDTDTATRQEIRLYMRTSAVFSLAHVEDADPKTGEGICLGVPQQEWLKEFRAAIANCMEEEGKSTSEGSETDDVTFEVTGYASIAPMHVGGDTSKSAKLNCKVANWRAAAVGAFLADPNAEEHKKRWSCKHVRNDFNNEPIECGKLTNGPYEGTDPQGNRFLVDVHQWPTPDQMAEGKPADDGTPNERRFDVEILNRVVHIEVPEDFCGDASQEASAP